jgi:SAM-dependent methyltransferase
VTSVPGPWETSERDVFRARFGEDPDAYERTRPVAPAVVFDDIVARAGLRAGDCVLEIGPGTGQATQPLLARHLKVHALEIDGRLAARASRSLARFPGLVVDVTSFEDWNPGDATFDAVLACNSFHWIDPDVRFAKAARALSPDGHLVVISTPVVVPPDADRFWWDIQDDWAAVGAERVDPATKDPDAVADFGSAVRASRLFDEPAVARYPFAMSVTADDYVANLATQSGVKELPPAAQKGLLERVGRRLRARGGTLTVRHVAVVTTAKRAT